MRLQASLNVSPTGGWKMEIRLRNYENRMKYASKSLPLMLFISLAGGWACRAVGRHGGPQRHEQGTLLSKVSSRRAYGVACQPTGRGCAFIVRLVGEKRSNRPIITKVILMHVPKKGSIGSADLAYFFLHRRIYGWKGHFLRFGKVLLESVLLEFGLPPP